MAFGDFLRGIVAQINPFDGGKTFSSERRRREEEEERKRAAQPKQPSISVRPVQNVFNQDQLRVQPTRSNFVLSGVSAPKVKDYNVRVEQTEEQRQQQKQRQMATAARNKWNQTGSAAPFAPQVIDQMERDRAREIASQSVGDKARKAGRSVITGADRFGVGLFQGLGGLYDLVTPGKGTNRFTKAFNRRAEHLDELVRRENLNSKVYRGTQIVGELATGAGIAGGAKNLATRGPRLVRAGAGKLNKLVNRIANRIPGSGRTSRLTRATVRELGSPEAIAGEAYFANKAIGESAARGEDISPGRIAFEYGAAVPGAAASTILGRVISRLARRTPTPPPRTNIPVRSNIPVNVLDNEAEVAVRNLNRERPLIREVGGDAPTPAAAARRLEQEAEEALAKRVREQPRSRPDRRIEGMASRERFLGEARGVTQIEIDTERAMLDEALANKEITKAQHKAANKLLDETVPTDAPPPKGRPIAVREVQGIPVEEQVAIPNMPETPGVVRPMAATDQTAARTATAAAEAPPTPPRTATSNVEGVADEATPSGRAEGVSPNTNESTREFLTRIFQDGVGDDLQRGSAAWRNLRKLRKAERSQRLARAKEAERAVREAGGTFDEGRQAYKASLRGDLGTAQFEGRGFDWSSPDGQRLESMIDEFFESRGQAGGFQHGGLKDSFNKLFNYGVNKDLEHIQPGDIKNIRKFFNQAIPDAHLGDGVEQLIRDIETVGGRDPNFIQKAFGLMRSIMFSGDAGTIFRQTKPAGLLHPVSWAKSAKIGFETMFNKRNFEELVRFLETDKYANYMNDELGVDLTMLKGMGEEQFRNSQWSDSIPVVKQIVNASNRFFDAQTNMMRYLNTKKFIDDMGGIASFEKHAQSYDNPEAFKQAFGRVVNTNTGRGQLGKLGTPEAAFLSEVFTSPKGLAARLQRLNPGYYRGLFKTNKTAFKEAVSTLVLDATVTIGTLALAKQSGLAEVEDGKIRIGNTRYDITGGVMGILTTLNDVRKFMFGEEQTTPFTGAEKEVIQWFQNQMTPGINLIFDAIGYSPDPKTGERKNKYGDIFDPTNIVIENLTPLNVSGVINDTQEGVSLPQTAANFIADSLGISANTYRTSADKSAEAEAEIRGQYDALAKYLPEGTDEITHDLITKVADDSFWAADWDAYVQAMEANVAKVAESTSSTKEKRDKAELDLNRARFYRQNNILPELIDQYDDIGVSLWRKMGDPESEEYNPELYEELANLDAMMTEANISFNTTQGKGPSYRKYTAKESGGGRRKRANVSVDFGGFFGTPKVREYEQTNLTTGNRAIPVIKRVRPNINHKITQSR